MCGSIRVTSLEYWSLAPGCHRCANNVRRLDIQQKDASVRCHRAQPATHPLIPLRTVQDQGRRRRIEHHHEGTGQSPKLNSGGLARLKLFLTCQFPLKRSWQETAVVWRQSRSLMEMCWSEVTLPRQRMRNHLELSMNHQTLSLVMGYHDDHQNYIKVVSRRSKKKNRGFTPSNH